MTGFIPISVPDVTGREEEYVRDCIQTGWVSSIGAYVERFETEFAKYCGRPHGVSLNSGTAAIHLALRVLDVGPGDEVIIPSLTFASVANCVLYQGATPVFVDCGPDNWNVDPANVEQAISDRTKAIMPVHLYGLPCDIERILTIAQNANLPVIEDCAEAHGARVGSQAGG